MTESRAAAVQALINQWRESADHLTSSMPLPSTQQDIFRLRHCADDLAALLLREGPPQEGTIERQLDYLRDAMREALKLSKDAPDEDIIDQAGEQADWLSNYEKHMKAIAAAAGVRLNGSEQQWSDMAREVIAGLREGQEPPEVCKTCQGRRYVMRGMWNQPCPDCTGLREGPPAPSGHAGEAPQEGVPDHCENCRAKLPVTTVHLCHACLPSAPRDHAGEAPATEPEQDWPNFMEIQHALVNAGINVGFGRTSSGTLKAYPSPVVALAASQAGTALDYEVRYFELIYAVGNKYAGESRHETALRYIRKAEEPNGQAAASAHGAVPPQEP